MYEWGIVRIVGIDKRNQCGASGQYRLEWVFQAPILAKFRYGSFAEIKCEKPRQFLGTERPGSDGNTLEHSVGKFPICLIDLSQGAFICFIDRLWQLGQDITDAFWGAARKMNELTMCPTE